MSISVQCECGKKYQISNERAGSKVRCKECGEPLMVGTPAEAPQEKAAVPLADKPGFWKKWKIPITTFSVVGAVSLTLAVQQALQERERKQEREGRTRGPAAPTNPVSPPPSQPTIPASKEQIRYVNGFDCVALAATASGSRAICATGEVHVGFRLFDTSPSAPQDRTYSEGSVRNVSVSDDAARAAAVTGVTAHVWDLQNGNPLASIKIGSSATVLLSPDGRFLVAYTALPEKSLSIWDIDSGEVVRKLTGLKGTPTVTSFSDDGQRVLALADGAFYIWNFEDGATKKTVALNPISYGAVGSLPRSGKFAAVMPQSQKVLWIYDLESGEKLHEKQFNVRRIGAVAVSGDGRYVFAGLDNEIAILDAETGEEVSRMTAGLPFTHLAASADGSRVLSIDTARAFAVWAPELRSSSEPSPSE